MKRLVLRSASRSLPTSRQKGVVGDVAAAPADPTESERDGTASEYRHIGIDSAAETRSGSSAAVFVPSGTRRSSTSAALSPRCERFGSDSRSSRRLESGEDTLHSAPVRIYDRDGVWVAMLHAGVDLSENNLLHDIRAALAADGDTSR